MSPPAPVRPTSGVRSLEVEVRPPSPFRLPRRGGGDGVTRCRDAVISRLLRPAGEPVVVCAWQRRRGEVAFRASGPCRDDRPLALAIERMRFALGVDEDLSDFYREFRRDPLIGPAIRRRPWLRPRRRPWPWEALAWAITEQLIESSRAAEIQRRMVRRWGASADLAGDPWSGCPAAASASARSRDGRPWPLRDVPAAAALAARAPAELAACDLAPARALALIRCAREVVAKRADLADPAADCRLRSIPEIGPWTTQCLGLRGRGDADSLPAGDLAYVKLVGRLAGLNRRATIPEIEEFFAPYEPYRGLAGTFAIAHYHAAVQTGPPLRLAS